MSEIADYLLQRSATTPLTVLVTDPGYIPMLSLPQGHEKQLHAAWVYNEPHLNIVYVLTCDSQRISYMHDGNTYAYARSHVSAASAEDPFAPIKGPRQTTLLVSERLEFGSLVGCLPLSKKLIATYVKPGGRQIIDVFEVLPASQ